MLSPALRLAMSDRGINYEEEIENLLEDGIYTKGDLAYEFLHPKLEIVPQLQERIEVLEHECICLHREINLLEREVDCGTYMRSESAEFGLHKGVV